MSEPTLLHPPQQGVGWKPERVRSVRIRDLAIRFAFGAATSLVAGIISLAFGPRAGGLFLAFPAILAASLTLIATEEDREAAREDSRGAVAGAVALGAFAAGGAALFAVIPGAAALAAATTAWTLVAFGIYWLAWRPRCSRRSHGEPRPRPPARLSHRAPADSSRGK